MYDNTSTTVPTVKIVIIPHNHHIVNTDRSLSVINDSINGEGLILTNLNL
jgi:hypothetical protein